MDTVTLLLSSFVLSVTGLLIFIWSLRKRLFDTTSVAANVIFSPGEIGQGEEPSLSAQQRAGMTRDEVKPVLDAATEAAHQQELAERVEADRSSAFVTFVFLSCAVVWLTRISAWVPLGSTPGGPMLLISPRRGFAT